MNTSPAEHEAKHAQIWGHEKAKFPAMTDGGRKSHSLLFNLHMTTST